MRCENHGQWQSMTVPQSMLRTALALREVYLLNLVLGVLCGQRLRLAAHLVFEGTIEHHVLPHNFCS